jgi:hypothetical protein
MTEFIFPWDIQLSSDVLNLLSTFMDLHLFAAKAQILLLDLACPLLRIPKWVWDPA